MKQIRWVEALDLFEGFGYGKAISALASLLESGFDPAKDHSRLHVNFDNGEGLLMPSEIGDRVGLKFVTVAPSNPAKGLDRIQGIYSLLDAATLTPLLQCDGAALTLLRTSSMTAATVKRLRPRRHQRWRFLDLPSGSCTCSSSSARDVGQSDFFVCTEPRYRGHSNLTALVRRI